MSDTTSYPVRWAERDGPAVSGGLTIGPEALLLGGSVEGRAAGRAIAYRDLGDVGIARTPPDALGGRPTLVLTPRYGRPVLVSPIGFGLLHEIADILARLCAENEPLQQIAVVFPLKPSSVETVRSLVADGPPFDPADVSLTRHDVFLTSHEAIVVFTGADACDSVRRIMRDPSVWSAAGRWASCLAGPPRLAEAGYAWASLA